MNPSEASILVVDDEPMLLEIFSKSFRAVGWRDVFTAANGAAALALLEVEHIDILLSDVRMPIMDGITLVRRLAETGGSLPKIIFVSGFGDVDRREMYALGVEAFVDKPFDFKELLSALERSVAERSTLWHTKLAATPRQKVVIHAERMDTTACLETIGLGRGGFSALSPEPLNPGKVTFRLLLSDSPTEITGQGYVRWYSRGDCKAGIEFAFIDPGCSAELTEAITRAAPRSFIPSS